MSPLATKKKLSAGSNAHLLSTREYYSGSHFFPNFVPSIPTHASLIFYGESVFRAQFWRSRKQLYRRLTIRTPRVTSLSKLESSHDQVPKTGTLSGLSSPSTTLRKITE